MSAHGGDPAFRCYLPGAFTGIAGLAGEAAGLLAFAGEHTDSFHEWQGFTEGAATSGVRAAGEVLEDLERRRIGPLSPAGDQHR